MNDQKVNPMPLVGYCDKLSVRKNETIRFMVSCDLPSYKADFVRLIHGDDNPKGPGFIEHEISSIPGRECSGRRQNFEKGSYVVVPFSPVMGEIRDFTLQAWIYPTTPSKCDQGIVTDWIGSDGPGYGLFLTTEGYLSIVISDREGKSEWVKCEKKVYPRTWYFVACTYNSDANEASLCQVPVPFYPESCTSVMAKANVKFGGSAKAPLLIGGCWGRSASGELIARSHFNGKIDRPRVFSRTLAIHEIESLRLGGTPNAFISDLLASWDLSDGISSAEVRDTSPHKLHGHVVNCPKRGVTGYNWIGNEVNFNNAPNEYGAIHFHDDDLDDAKWLVDFEFTIPNELGSGVYAARLRSGQHKDYVPFFVRPDIGVPTARIAFLAPSLSYLAYANEHLMEDPNFRALHDVTGKTHVSKPSEKYTAMNGLLSLYESHSDGSGVCYSTRLRPLLNIRPDYKEAVLSGGQSSPHQFSEDLCLLNWMEEKGYRYDVITDEDLHFEGADLLAPYRVIVSGTHPEYWSGRMLDALQGYLNNGGKFMYLGGNGLYWVTSIDPARPHVIEVRRWGGTQAWRSDPGEYYHSSTGELGGLWRNRGHAPQKILGVGFTSQGFDRKGIDTNRPYRRLPDSKDAKVSFIFEGIEENELIGDFDCLVQQYGAGGYEIDRLDNALGTPQHTLWLATATGFSDTYQRAVEEIDFSNSKQGGTIDPLVRADITYLEYPNGGAVFSVGSIAWCGCLYYNGCNNNVSRMTENVLKHFVGN